MKRLLLLVALLSNLAAADPWFRPAHAGPDYINSDLTSRRALKGSVKPGWHGQLVLWDGRILQQDKVRSKHRLRLATPDGEVQVVFPKKVLNLEHDRRGFRVAVKGHLQLKNGIVDHLSGRSVILLSPPREHPFESPPRPPDLSQEPLFDFLTWWIHFHNPTYSPELLTTIASSIILESRKNQLDPLFLASLIQVESAFDIDARSVSGAIGLGQLMPFTADGLGVDAHDPASNVAGSARMIGGLVKEFRTTSNPRALALASYNAGPNLVRQLGRVPRYSQTTNYVYFIGFVHRTMTRIAQARGQLNG